jgi:NADH-quinone oxidoreductase subunit N
VLTLLVGNLAAIPQRNFKRLLAYSSVAHAGFLLTALSCAPRVSETASGISPAKVIAFYLGAYLLMTLLAFLVMMTIRKAIADEDFDAYRGLAKRSPFLAGAMVVSMASLAGIPLTAGFIGKLFVFKLAIEQGRWVLVAVALVGAAAGFYYYLKIAASMYLESEDKKSTSIDAGPIAIGKVERFAMIMLMIGIFAVGINPGLILGLLP